MARFNWYLKYAGTPADLSGNASRIFLGVQIQCAQCHDHKTEKWKQTDFQQFTACFTRTRGTNLDKGQKGGFQRIVLKDQDGTRGIRRPNPNAKNKKANALLEYASAKPAAPGRHGLFQSDQPPRGFGEVDDIGRKSLVRAGNRQPNVGLFHGTRLC